LGDGDAVLDGGASRLRLAARAASAQPADRWIGAAFTFGGLPE
jgi:hypothetical protein